MVNNNENERQPLIVVHNYQDAADGGHGGTSTVAATSNGHNHHKYYGGNQEDEHHHHEVVGEEWNPAEDSDAANTGTSSAVKFHNGSHQRNSNSGSGILRTKHSSTISTPSPLFAEGDEQSHLLPKSAENRRSRREGFVRQHTSFWDDAKQMKEGTIPQSMVVALVVGIVCGVAACLYYKCLEYFLDLLWKTLPEKYIIDQWSESYYVLWIPLVGFTMAVLVGVSVLLLGEPGDLAYTIKCVHTDAYISMDHVMPMVAASQFSILGGGSLGPEAPLVAICAALGGFVSRYMFRQTKKNLVRKHTLMGMAAALAAFFGCPLGGSLFALEVNSRMGVEYFEHVMESIFAGEVCLAVFRGLAQLPIQPIWTFDDILEEANSATVIQGALIGLLGAGIAAIFSKFHWTVMDQLFNRLGWLDNSKAIQRALLGSVVIVGLGVLIPQTLFWGEFEFQTIASLEPSSKLAHIFPTSGFIGFEIDSSWKCLLVGFTKLIAISFTVAGGYRGGFIFPFFATGAAFGRALHFWFPTIFRAPLACLCFAAGINVAITRTALATSIILVYLSGEPNCMAPVLAASLMSLFVTGYMPFIKTQVARADIEHSIFHMDDHDTVTNTHHHSGDHHYEEITEDTTSHDSIGDHGRKLSHDDEEHDPHHPPEEPNNVHVVHV